MKLAVPKETFPGERRVALVPAAVGALKKLGWEVVIEAGAGGNAGYVDSEYEEKGAQIVESRDDCFHSDVILQVRCFGANVEAGREDLARMKSGQVLIGTCDPLGQPESVKTLGDSGVSLLALELIPRITRAQSMDVLSSMATVAGYRAVLLAATHLPRMFPLMMTAAGTLSPARVFVIGAGVAGLQAIATSRRLGAIVQAYDVRPAVGEQVESLGAKFVSMDLDTSQAEDKGGYAKELGDEFYQKQREFMAQVVAQSDVVITTAAIPGKTSPQLITEEAVRGMQPGSVIVDLAAERGGNCALTQADQQITAHGVTILGPTNLPSEIPYHASQMFSKNVQTLLQHLTNDGEIQLDTADEITVGTLATHQGQVVHPRLRELLGLPAQAQADGSDTATETQQSADPS